MVDGGGNAVRISNPGREPFSVMPIAGEPIGGAAVRYGPFVMNDREGLQQAVDNLRNCELETLCRTPGNEDFCTSTRQKTRILAARPKLVATKIGIFG